MSSLLDEDGFIIFETGDTGQGFDAEAGVFQGLAAALEGLFDDDADTGDSTACLGDDVRQADGSSSTGQEVIDDENRFAGVEIGLADRCRIFFFFCIRVNLGCILFAFGEQRFFLAGKDDGQVIQGQGSGISHSDARRFDSDDAVDVYVFETAGELLTDVIDEGRIDLLFKKLSIFKIRLSMTRPSCKIRCFNSSITSMSSL